MQIMMTTVKNQFIDYLGIEEDIMEEYGNIFSRIPNPDFIAWLDHKNEKGWVVVKDTPENIELFNKRFKDVEIPDSVAIYYNEPYYYDLIVDGFDTRNRIEEEKKRQERINNPEIDLDINSKEELIEYLVSELLSNEETLMWEYSTDFDVSEAELKAKGKELKRLVNKYLY